MRFTASNLQSTKSLSTARVVHFNHSPRRGCTTFLKLHGSSILEFRERGDWQMMSLWKQHCRKMSLHQYYIGYYHYHNPSLGHHRWLCNQFSYFSPILLCPLGLAELQACPFSGVVFPSPPSSAPTLHPFHCALKDDFDQAQWTAILYTGHYNPANCSGCHGACRAVLLGLYWTPVRVSRTQFT